LSVSQDRLKNTSKISLLNNYSPNWEWKDLQTLAKKQFGLRHVSSLEQKEKEALEGIHYGCSLSLSPQPLVDREIYQSLPEFDSDKQAKLIEQFAKGVDQFIDQSIIYDLHQGKGELLELYKTKMIDVAKVVNSCQFSLVDYSKNLSHPIDLSVWGAGLGRYPKEIIEAQNVYPVSTLTIQDLKLSQENLEQTIDHKELGDHLFQILIKTYRVAIIQHFRSINSE